MSIKALTAVGLEHLSQRSSIPTKVLLRLKNAGLTSLQVVVQKSSMTIFAAVICNGKKVLLNTSRFTVRLTVGLPSNCTMLFGTIESLEQRLQHMVLLRELNEQTAAFQCFVPYPFLP